MKLQPFFVLCFATLIAWLPCSLALASDQTVTSATELMFSDQDAITEFNRLESKAIDEGSVQVMVVLKDGTNIDSLTDDDKQEKTIATEQDSVMAELPASDAQSVKRYEYLPLLAISADAKALKRLRRSPHVARIVEDHMNFALSHETSQALTGASASWALGYTGAGQTIAILDNGVDKNHPMLAGRVVKEACFSSNNKKQKVSSSCKRKRTRDLKPGSASVTCGFQDFACSHGTLLAGLAAGNSSAAGFAGSGVAPQANIIAVKVDSFIKNKKVCGSTKPCRVFFDSDLLRGLDFVYKQRKRFSIASANVSIGGNASPGECKRNPLGKIVKILTKANIATIAASGNEGFKNRLSTPACVPGVIAVGSTNNSDAVMSFSNSAKSLALLAAGLNLGLPMPGVVPTGFEVVASGTSLSAAQVTGAWASLKSHKPTATVKEILNALINTGLPLTDPKNGKVTSRIRINLAHTQL